MELFFLDENFAPVSPPVELAVSAVWSLRYQECGTFTVHLPLTEGIRDRGGEDAAQLLALASDSTYLCDREHCGRIESVVLRENTAEIGGRMLECLLYDRVAAADCVYTGTVTEAAMQALAQWAPDSIFTAAETQPDMGEPGRYPLRAGVSLGAWLHRITGARGGSYTVRLGTGRVPVFTLVQGVNRSLDGEPGVSRVIFSEDFGNMAELEMERYREAAVSRFYIEGADGTVETVDSGEPAARRRERFVRAEDISPDAYASEEEYRAALRHRGEEELARWGETVRLSCTAEDTALPAYGTDYTLGDICEIRSRRLGISSAVRLTAIDIVCEAGTRKLYPMFGDSVLRIRTAVYSQ